MKFEKKPRALFNVLLSCRSIPPPLKKLDFLLTPTESKKHRQLCIIKMQGYAYACSDLVNAWRNHAKDNRQSKRNESQPLP